MKHTTRHVAFATFAAMSLAGTAPAQEYAHSWQYKYVSDAQFFVEGPATGAYPDVEGDAMLTRVKMPTGDTFRFFYKPEAIVDVQYTGHEDYAYKWAALGGSRTTEGLNSRYPFSNFVSEDYFDDDEGGSEAGVAQFEALVLNAFRNNNLNNYLDTGSNHAKWEMTIMFDMIVKDDDPAPDEFGEILYFERGAGDGNSWIKMQAVDETGAPLGPWLVVGPNETVQTTPQTAVMRSDQKMGTTSIDVSRLGVEEFQYLRISNAVSGEAAYTGGGDQNPDFKVMAVVTNEDQLAALLGHYD